MSLEVARRENTFCVLIECPRWGDAKFLGNWLLAADMANDLWREAEKDPYFAKQVERLQGSYELDLALEGYILAMRIRPNISAFIIEVGDAEAESLAMMAEMGFFTLAGERYQMAIPSSLSVHTIKRALLKLAQTEDSKNWLHPEYLVNTMPYAEAEKWQRRLSMIREYQHLVLNGDQRVH